MSKLQKLKFINNTSRGWKVMFELYDWIRWSNDNGEDTYSRYWYFMSMCEDKLLSLGLTLDAIPRYTTSKNAASRWFYLNGKFKNIQDMQKLFDHDSYRIIMLRGIISVRFKDNES